MRTPVISLLIAVTFGAIWTPGHGQTANPRLGATDMVYLGAFSIPDGSGGPPSATTSRAGWGGIGLTPYNDPVTGKHTLFIHGHAQVPGWIAQISIPSSFVASSSYGDLPVASIIQDFADVTDGKLSTLTSSPYAGVYWFGLLAWNGRLIVGASIDYGSNQVTSHGASGFDLSVVGDFTGFLPLSATYSNPSAGALLPRAVGGYMTPIPTEWRALFGAPALTGQCCLAMIGASTSGPGLASFNPDDVGQKSPIPATGLLYFPTDHPACEVSTGSSGCATTQNAIYNLATSIRGVAFPSGTRTVLFIGGHGTGCYGYGAGVTDPTVPVTTFNPDCSVSQYVYASDGVTANYFDPVLGQTKGPHGYPYQYQVWAYDANDLLMVKNGTKAPWQVSPYAVWNLPDLTRYAGGSPLSMSGAAFDPDTNLLYIATSYGEAPRIDVYKINTVRPLPPGGVSAH